ncbi:MAG: TRAP transporter substrate-binding protein [Clostridia bacterium]|nr:TRAP transporter substrate-binding protein [Clostridia bacterium]
MKKILLFVLSVLMLLSLAACGASGTDKTASASASSSGSSPANAEPVTLRVAHGASESYHMSRAMEQFKTVAEESGLFTIQIYPNQTFGADKEMIEGVMTGDLDMAVVPTSYLTDYVPNMALIELPYMFPFRAVAVETLKDEWAQNELALLEDAGLHGFGFLENGMRNLTNSKKEIRLPSDVSGLKLRTMSVEAHVKYWNSLGASAEGSAFSELYTNLSTGVYDGQENPIAHIFSNKFYEVQKYISITEHVYTAYIPIMTADAWNSLSDEQQAVLNEAYQTAYDFQMKTIAEEEASQLQKMVDFGCVVTTLTDAEKQAWIDSAKTIHDDYRASLGAETYDAFTSAIDAAAAKVG